MNREKYKNIIYNLENINKKINTINKEMYNLEEILKKNMVINNSIIEKNQISKIEDDLNLVASYISEEVIRSLNNKIF